MRFLKIIGRAYRFIHHWLTACNTKGHGIHSPFLFRLVENVIYEKHPFYVFETIEKEREELKNSQEIIFQKDFGTGTSAQKQVSDIAKTSLKRKYWGQFLFRLVHFTEPKNILELGTSLGITTSYLATANKSAHCTTLEGSEEIAKIAQETLKKNGADNTKIVVGDINKTLPKVLENESMLDFVFFDANHQREAVLKYFNQCVKKAHSKSVFVFDDIYWSKGMQKVWREICRSEKVTATLDLHELGIVFFDKNLPQRTFKLRGNRL